VNKEAKHLEKALKDAKTKCYNRYHVLVKKHIMKHGTLIDGSMTLPLFSGDSCYRIYQLRDDNITYITVNDLVRDVNTIGRLLQALELMLDNLKNERRLK
jgi:hypothetical protein